MNQLKDLGANLRVAIDTDKFHGAVDVPVFRDENGKYFVLFNGDYIQIKRKVRQNHTYWWCNVK